MQPIMDGMQSAKENLSSLLIKCGRNKIERYEIPADRLFTAATISLIPFADHSIVYWFKIIKNESKSHENSVTSEKLLCSENWWRSLKTHNNTYQLLMRIKCGMW